MTDITDVADDVYRDFVIPGVPSSGNNEPSKPAIRDLFGQIGPSIEILRRTWVDLGALLADAADKTVRLQQILDAGALDDKTTLLTRNYDWSFLTRPANRGPQGQYWTLPKRGILEAHPGVVFDCSGMPATGGAANFLRPADATIGDWRPLAESAGKGTNRIVLASGQAAGLPRHARLRIRTLTRQDTLVGGFTLRDFTGFAATVSIVDDVMSVSATDSAVLARGTSLTGGDLAPDTLILQQLSGPAGGVGTYRVSPAQTMSEQSVLAWVGGGGRGEDVHVGSVDGDVVTTIEALRDTYDLAAMPVVERITDEPQLRIVGLHMLGVGAAADDRALFVGGGRDVELIDCRFDDFAQGPRLYSIDGLLVDGLRIETHDTPRPGGGVTIGGTTHGTVRRVRTLGGPQPVMLSGITPWYGITRDLLFEDGLCEAPAVNGPSSHNTSELTTFRKWTVTDAGFHGFDWRSPDGVFEDCVVRRAANTSFWIRIAINGLRIKRATCEDCAGGVVLTNYPDDPRPWDRVPGDIEVSDSAFTGLYGPYGALQFRYERTFDECGDLWLLRNRITMKSNARPIDLRGKWRPEIRENELRAVAGYTPVGNGILLEARSFDGAGGGPRDPSVTGNRQDPSFGSLYVADWSGAIETAGNKVIGLNVAGVTALTADTVLRTEQVGDNFNNKGATGAITVTLPVPGHDATPTTFWVVEAQEIELRPADVSPIRIGSGPRGLNLRSATPGARARLQRVDRSLGPWDVEVDDGANWMMDWSPYALDATDQPVWLDFAAGYIRSKSRLVRQWLNLQPGTFSVDQDEDHPELQPLTTETSLDFAGGRYLTTTTAGGLFVTGPTSRRIWMILQNGIDPSDTADRIYLSIGGAPEVSAQIGRTVVGGVNRAFVSLGDGATAQRAVNGAVDFGDAVGGPGVGYWHSVVLELDGTSLTCIVDGVASSATTVTGATTAARITVGGSSDAAPTNLCGGKIRGWGCQPLGVADWADHQAWMAAEVARLNASDPGESVFAYDFTSGELPDGAVMTPDGADGRWEIDPDSGDLIGLLVQSPDALTVAMPNDVYTIDVQRAAGTTQYTGQTVAAGTWTVPVDASPLQLVTARHEP